MNENFQPLFSFLGIDDPGMQRSLIEQLKAIGMFDGSQAEVYLEKAEAPEAKKNALPAVALVMLDPATVKVDAPTYQFRSGGDGNGVTKRGKFKAEQWSPILHGDPILVHERLDGTFYVADGHHRLDLANRLNAEGKGPGAIAAQVLREADGYTALDAKIIAAYKNIAHGHTDPVDVARVFKEAYSGRVHTEWLPSLQMDKGNLRMSFSLSKLSDKALDQIAAQDVPAEMAAQVAERVSEPDKQDEVMAIIGAKLKQDYTPAGHGFAHKLRRSKPVSGIAI